MKPIYFDLTVQDVSEARAFFEAVLGWRFERFPLPYEYYRIQAGGPDEPGIDGGVGGVSDAPICEGRPLTQVTMPVADLDTTLEAVLENGGRIVEPKKAIPAIGWYATCAEPGGLMFGLLQADADAR